MSHSRTSRVVGGAILAIGLALLGPPAALAASGPSPVERAVTVTSPGVVFIETSTAVKVRLAYQNPAALSGLGVARGTYYWGVTGSGFVVSPDGVIVTASHVVEPDEQAMRNLATNSMLLDGLGYSYDGSPLDQYRITDSVSLNRLLQQCYRGIACDFGITAVVTVYSAHDIAQAQLPSGVPARILTSTGFENTDVAVLQVNGTNMPTVDLAGTVGDLAVGDDLTALGFPGSSRDNLQTGVTEPTKIFGKVSNVRDEGTSKLIEVDLDIEGGMSGGPVIDAEGRVVGLSSFGLFQSTGERAAAYLRTVDDIKIALADAGVSVSRGPVDASFEKSMDLLWGHHYSAAIPEFERVLSLYPGHPLATKYLADAQAKKGTAADVPLAAAKGAGFPVVLVAAIGAGVLLLAGVVIFVVRGMRRAPAPAAPLAAPIAAPPNGQPAPSVGVKAAVAVGAAARPSARPETPPELARFCSSCGHGLEEGARFCPSCGHPVGA